MAKINKELKRQVRDLKKEGSRLPGYVSDNIMPSLMENIGDATGELMRHFNIEDTESDAEVAFTHNALYNGLIGEIIGQLKKEKI